MQGDYLSLLGGVAPVFVIIAAGFGIRRISWLTAEADRSLLRLTLNLLYPCLIFDSILGNSILKDIGNVTLAPAVGFFTIVIGLLFCALAARMLPLDARQARTFAFTAGIYNYGYIPVPLVQKFFGQQTMGMLFTYNLGVEAAFWTVGITMLTLPAERGNGWKRLLNGPVVAIVVSLLLNFCHAHEWLPSFLLTSIHIVGQSHIPLSLILTGATLADLLLQNHPRTPGIAALGGCVARVMVLPVVFLAIARFLPCTVELKQIIVVQAAMPSAMLPIVIARHYGGDPDTAMQIVLSTTLAGLLTIPFWIQLGMRLAGV